MGVFQGYGADLPTQLWLAARYMTGLTFLLAPLFIRKKLNSPITFAVYISVTSLLFASIFYWKIFPDCFIDEGTGLTTFKKASEYVVGLIFLASLGFLLQKKEAFDKETLKMLVLSILVSVVQGIFFTTYASVYAFSNMIGHFFGVFSFYCIYRAIILTGLTRPLDLIFRNLNQSKEALSESEKEFRGIFELSAVGMAQVDLKTNRFIRFNNTFCDICGYSADELRHLTFSDITYPDDRHKDFEALQRALSRETDGWKIEKRYIRKDGTVVWVNVTGTVIFDDAGQPLRGTSVIEDVTERKLTELKLLKEHRAITLANRIMQVFVKESGDDMYDKALSIVMEGMQSRHGVFGYIDENGVLVCPSMTKLLDQCEIEGRCIHYPPAKWRGLWARALMEKRALYTNEPPYVPPGHPVINNNLASPLLFQGEVIGLLNLANKETAYTDADRELLEAIADRIAPVLYAWIQKEMLANAHRLAEETIMRLASFPRLDPNPVFELNQAGEITFLNEATVTALEKLGLDKKAVELFIPHDADEIFSALRDKKEKVFHREANIKNSVFYESIYVAPEFNAVRIYAMDITERKQAMEALKIAHFEMESRVRERTAELKKLNEALETEIAGRKEINTILIEQSKFLESFFIHTPTCLVFLDREFNFIRVNEAYARACGRDASDFLGYNHFELFPSDELKENFQRVVETKKPYTVFARPFTFPDRPEWGVTYWDLNVAPILDEADEVAFLAFSLLDVTEQKEIENRVDITNRLLQMFVQQISIKDYINSVIRVLQEWSGCRCIGIRLLDENSQIPYEAYTGFSDEFMQTENCLSIERDQCACIRVIKMAPDPADLTMMTENGSFFCNNTFEYVNTLSDREKLKFRGVCIQKGFKSVAIIPVRYNEKIFGAIHLADEKEGMVPLKKVAFIESLSLIIGEVIHRLNAEEALRSSQEQLRNLAAHLQSAREDERTKIAREIHDELGQIMTALKIDLSWIRDKYCDHAGLCEKTKSMLSHVDATIRTVKKIITELRPGILDHLGISAALEWQASEFQEISGIPCNVVIIPDQIILTEDLSTNIFRIFQEILTNVMRHAGATQVDVLFEKRDGWINLSVEDNGKGITRKQISKPASFGITGMRERVNIMNGEIEIAGTHGKGTSISISIPIPVDLNLSEQGSLQHKG
jgi:PAS domain S-box-containing protein